MTWFERLYAALIVAGTWLGILVRAVLWLIVGVLVIVAFVLLAIWGTTTLGRQVEYRTRPE